MDIIRITTKIKVFAGILLLACIVLPFSSCSKQLDEEGRLADVSKKPAVKTETTYNYAWENFDTKDLSAWLFLLSFIWPLPIVLYRQKVKVGKLRVILWGCEPLLAMAAAYDIWVVSHILATPAIGAYLALFANFAYFSSWEIELVTKINDRMRYKKLSG